MDLSLVSTTTVFDDQSWLASADGTAATKTITLDLALFTAATHFPNGHIPSGTPLGKKTSTGLYGPYDDTASDGRQTASGFLFGLSKVGNGLPGVTSTAKIGGALLWRGAVRLSKLPIALDSAGQADLAAKFDLR